MDLETITTISMQGMLIWNSIFFLLGIIITLLIAIYKNGYDTKQSYQKGYADGIDKASKIVNEVFKKNE